MTDFPRFHKRAFAHNYHAPFIYHIILKKEEKSERFGSVKGDARIAPGNPGAAHIEESATGSIIAKSILGLQNEFPILRIYQFMVMPDHVHILLRVKDWSDKHLDFYINHLVANIEAKVGKQILQPGYCDKPLLLKRSLDGLFKYIRENPHRLAMRQQFPQFFQHARELTVGSNKYAAYGNLFLLRNPDIDAVKISSKFSPAEKQQMREKYLNDAATGTVLVSPFISQEEKAIRYDSEALGANIILIAHEAFGERFKPAAHDFDLCSSGRLLIISLGLPANTPLTRQICLQMNALAQTIATTPLQPLSLIHK